MKTFIAFPNGHTDIPTNNTGHSIEHRLIAMPHPPTLDAGAIFCVALEGVAVWCSSSNRTWSLVSCGPGRENTTQQHVSEERCADEMTVTIGAEVAKVPFRRYQYVVYQVINRSGTTSKVYVPIVQVIGYGKYQTVYFDATFNRFADHGLNVPTLS